MKNTLSLFLLLLFSLTTHAQSWQWAKRGGTPSTSINNNFEEVYDMTTDKWGNVYVAALTNHTNIDIDGHALPDGNGFDNVVVASWDCGGNYRWAKFIGSAEGASAGWKPPALRTDTLGGVYLTGNISSTNPGTLGSAGYFRIGNDTSFGLTEKRLALIKLDTGGAYQWARLPQADTVGLSSASITGVIDMDVESDGTVHWLMALPQGAYANGQFVIRPSAGPLPYELYMVRYDRFGNYQSLIKPQVQLLQREGLSNVKFRYDSKKQRYLFGGNSHAFISRPAGPVLSTVLSFGSIIPKASYYVTAYSKTGSLIWFQEGTDTFSSASARPAYDEQGNVYIAGAGLVGDTFQNYVFTNTPYYVASTPYYYPFPFLIKLDSNGTLAVVVNGKSPKSSNAFLGVSYSNGVAACAGDYTGTVSFGNLSVSNPPNSAADVLLARFDAATGAVMSLDSAKSPFGHDDGSTAMAAGQNGNFYVGGRMANDLSFGPHTVTSVGGTSDWFVAKYGTPNCGCTTTPSPPTFTAAVPLSGGGASFSLTSPTGSIDSVVWIFGDGQRQVVTSNFTQPVSHNYAAADSYGVCVEIFTACGSSHKCQWIQVATGVENINALSFSLYPNPTDGVFTIESAQGGEATVHNLLGVMVWQQIVGAKETVQLPKSLAAGVYLLRFKDKRGNTQQARLLYQP